MKKPIRLVHEFLEQSAALYPDKTAIVCGDVRKTYAYLEREAESLAAYLESVGVQRHDRIAIFLDNSLEAVIAIFGILKTGAAFSVISPLTKAGKLARILRDSAAVALISRKSKRRTIERLNIPLPDLKHLVWCDLLESEQPPNVAAATNLATNAPWAAITTIAPGDRHPARVLDLDVATLIYTSGSTGDPKGIVSAHFNIVSAAQSITEYLENVPDDVILSAVPLSFDYGLYQVLMAFLCGATIALEKSFIYPHEVLAKIAPEQVTGFPLVPTMLAVMLQMDDLGRYDVATLRYVTNTAAALPPAHIKHLRKTWPTVKIYSMYGLTECKRVSYLPPDEIDRLPDSVGIPMPNTEVFVVDDAGRELPPGEIGELVVRGSNVMRGYWNDPVYTARVYRPGRCHGETLLYTGDLFRRDEEGYLYFLGRRDDMIKTKGERVSPREVEQTLCEVEGVAEAAIIAIPDEIHGSIIKAFVVPKVHASLSVRDVLRYCKLHLEPHMVPRDVEIRSSLPKTASGKIAKNELT